MIDPESIAQQVARAFPAEPLPARALLFKDHCDECIQVSNAYGGRRWTDITLQDLLAGGETALLTAVAWRYYLPAVITWCVRNPEAADVICDNLVYELEPPDSGKTDEWFAERRGGFSKPQREALLAYLHWYRARLEAEYASLEMPPPKHVYRALAYWSSDAAL